MRDKGHWFLTRTGKRFWPLDARIEDIDITDIAHGLSHICRFGGHCRHFYSVAQHSVIVSENLPPHRQLLGLLHDATEAYIGDMVRPLKIQMPDFKAIELRLWEVIALKFGLPLQDPSDFPEVKKEDNRALMTERRDLFDPSGYDWSIKEIPYTPRIYPQQPEDAMRTFLDRFHKLYGNANF